MLGVGCGGERDGARGDSPDANVGEPCDARREDGDESEHVSALLAATRTDGAATSKCSDSVVRWGEGGEFAVGRLRRPES